MTEFLWLLILVDGPLLIGLVIASFMLNRLPPLEAGAGYRGDAGASSSFSIDRNVRRGMI